jgi:hypothetical protein
VPVRSQLLVEDVRSSMFLDMTFSNVPKPAPHRTAFSFFLDPAMVRYITHNLLACHAKGCTTNNFPLKFTNVKLALREANFNPDFNSFVASFPGSSGMRFIQASRKVKPIECIE